jgi:RNA polymerase sigma-70 factor, ECF subfamily
MGLEGRVQALIAAGDTRTAAEEAIRALGPGVLRYLRAILRDEADAADAFSQVAEALWRGLPGFRGESSLRTWTLRVAVRAAMGIRNDAWRRRVRRLATTEISAIADEVRTSSPISAERRETAVDRLRKALSPEDQSLLVLRIDQRLSWPEIAAVISAEGRRANPAALAKRFERLKGRLALMAEREGLVERVDGMSPHH